MSPVLAPLPRRESPLLLLGALSAAALACVLALTSCSSSSEPEEQAAAPASQSADTADPPGADDQNPGDETAPDEQDSANPGWGVTGAIGSTTFRLAGPDVTSCETETGAIAVEAADEDGNSVMISDASGTAIAEITLDGTSWSSEGVPDDLVQFEANGGSDTLSGRGSLASDSGETTDMSVNVICLTLEEE